MFTTVSCCLAEVLSHPFKAPCWLFQAEAWVGAAGEVGADLAVGEVGADLAAGEAVGADLAALVEVDLEAGLAASAEADLEADLEDEAGQGEAVDFKSKATQTSK